MPLPILIALFALQRFGTGRVGWLFGPVILVFFVTIAGFGLAQIAQHPGVLQGLSPSWGARFMVDHGVDAWLTLGGVVLCCTGAEALYAEALEPALKKLGEEKQWSVKENFMLLRAILTGSTMSPPLLESMVVFGKSRTLDRVRRFLETQKKLTNTKK